MSETRPQAPIRPPSYRQAQIAKLLAWGWDYKTIGTRLKIHHRTVRHHVEELARLIPVGEESEHPDLFTPRERVLCWAFYEYRIKPTLRNAA